MPTLQDDVVAGKACVKCGKSRPAPSRSPLGRTEFPRWERAEQTRHWRRRGLERQLAWAASEHVRAGARHVRQRLLALQADAEAFGTAGVLRLHELHDEGEASRGPSVHVEVDGVVAKGVGELSSQVQHADEGARAEHVDHGRKPRGGEAHGEGPEAQVDDDHHAEQVKVLERDRQSQCVRRLLLLCSDLHHEIRQRQGGALFVNENGRLT
mmetsp:Transcript_11027/g.31396  ORF Transcript_11027/g.31396 Transcript_11027/m.31396 type:complete len:211 (-) Transcript_11027:649-1281(-)